MSFSAFLYFSHGLFDLQQILNKLSYDMTFDFLLYHMILFLYHIDF